MVLLRSSNVPPVLGLALDGGSGAALLSPAADLGVLQESVARSGARFLLLGGDGRGPRVDPSALAGVLRARWRGDLPGLLLAAGPTRDHPYNLARRVLALDHFTGGGVGLALLTADRGSAATTPPGTSAWTDASEGPGLTEEFARVVRGLWNTWPRESVVSDAAAGVFADSSRIHRLDHDGAWSVRGPLNSPSSPQGEPVLAWWIRSGTAGRFPAAEFALAADVADVVLLPADRVPSRRPASAARIVAVVTDPDPQPSLRALEGREWLDGLVLDARTPRDLLPEGVAPHVETSQGEALTTRTLRAALGLAERTLDLTDRVPAFGGAR